jgi:hypothetical protein
MFDLSSFSLILLPQARVCTIITKFITFGVDVMFRTRSCVDSRSDALPPYHGNITVNDAKMYSEST